MNSRLPVALTEGPEFSATVLRQSVERLGHALLVYQHPADLLAAIRQGQRFALLVVAEAGPADWGQLSSLCDTPVLLVTRETHRERLLAATRDLLWGSNAIDLLTVPVTQDEMNWRICTLLRRFSPPSQPSWLALDFSWQDYRFSAFTRTVFFRDQEVRLKPREYELALLMFRRINQVLTRELLMGTLGFSKATKTSRALDVCVSNVRKKLQLNAENGLMLHAQHRVGYMLLATSATDGLMAQP